MSLGRSRDQRIADDVGQDRSLMCAATGCPNRWSIDRGDGRLCSWHDRAQPHMWPLVTQEQQHAETERLYRPKLKEPVTVDREAGIRALRNFRVGGQDDPKAWAKLLMAREKSGERLTPAQRQMWRDALGFQTEAE